MYASGQLMSSCVMASPCAAPFTICTGGGQQLG